MDITQLHEIALEAANAAIKELARFYRDARIIDQTGKDLKTLADESSEKAILEVLRKSQVPIISEEDPGSHAAIDNGPFWVVDPLDGTVNFSRHFPVYGISIALWEGKEPRIGVIHDLYRGRTYSGAIGVGAWIDGQSFTIPDSNDLSQAILATGFPSKRDFSKQSLSKFAHFTAHFKKVRMIGAAAISLAYVSEGVFDHYCEEDIWLWDVAAGIAIIKAAGGDYLVKNLTDDLRATVHAGTISTVRQAARLL